MVYFKLFSFLCFIQCMSVINTQRIQFFKYKTKLQVYAEKWVEYYKINEMINSHLPPDSQIRSNIGDDSKCNTIDEIQDYFFNVYGNDTDKNTLEDIDEFLSYQVKKGGNEKYDKRQKKYLCERNECFGEKDVKELLNITKISRNNFGLVCPILLYNFEMDACTVSSYGSNEEEYKVWLLGLVFATCVALLGWSGCIVVPFIHSNVYKTVLTFMISLACGCLLSNSMLKFIPMADGFDMMRLHSPNSSYFYKHSVILGVIFFFFNFDRILKLFAVYKKEKKDSQKNIIEAGVTPDVKFSIDNDEDKSKVKFTDIKIDENDKPEDMNKRKRLQKSKSIDIGKVNLMGIHKIDEITDNFPSLTIMNSSDLKRQNSSDSKLDDERPTRICCTSITKGISNVRPIGWMAIFGDGLSNFIDGLSIGASINQGVIEGLTATLSIWIGNVPQELGDFALLCRAGMTPFQALFYNYCSSNLIYIGFIVGCNFGKTLSVARWIFSISGATTLYIGLGVLLPEMVDEFESTETFKAKVKITLIQLFGILTGYTAMIVLNLYEEDISI